MQSHARAAIAGLVLAGFGCPGTLDNPARFLIDAEPEVGPDGNGCPDIPGGVLRGTCTSAGCHSAADKTQGLDLESPGVASRLVGACALGGGLLIDPDQPSRSVMYAKVTIAPPFGSRMPLGKPPLDSTTIACVLSWVSAQKGTASDCDAGQGADVNTQ
jgi:hypothetical protein